MVNNYYKRGFLDGFDYIQRNFSNGDGENDKTTPYLIGGGLTALAGGVYGNSRTYPEQIDKEELVKELNRRKEFLDRIEKKISKIDKIKSDVSLFKDIIDWVKGGTIDPAAVEDELKRGDPTRLKKLLQEKKDEISELRERIKPLSNKIRNNRLVGAGIGLGTGLAGAALYNHIKSKNSGEDEKHFSEDSSFQKGMKDIKEKWGPKFEDGVNYAISKMFNEESDDNDLVSSTAAGAGLAGGLGGGFAWSRKNDGNIIAEKHLIKGIQEDTEKQQGKLKEAEKEINKREKNLKNAEIINGEKGSNPNKDRLESARGNLEDAKSEYSKIEDRIKGNQEDIKKSKSSIRNNRLKKFLKIGGGAAVGVGAGLGAAALYKRIKNKKGNKGE